MARTTYAQKQRTYQVLALALAEEKRLGLLTEAQFDLRHKEMMEEIFGPQGK